MLSHKSQDSKIEKQDAKKLESLSDDVLIEIASFLDSKSLAKVGFFERNNDEVKIAFNDIWKQHVQKELTVFINHIQDFKKYYSKNILLKIKVREALTIRNAFDPPADKKERLNKLFLEIIQSGNERIVELLINYIDLNDIILLGFVGSDDDFIRVETIFLNEAVKTKNPILVGILLAHGAKVNTGFVGRTINFDTPLMIAVKNNDPETLEVLLNAQQPSGSGINDSDWNGKTALHYAAEAGSLKCVKLLLQHGANKNLRCHKNLSAFDYATKSSNLGCIGLLSDMPEHQDRRGLKIR